MILYIESPKDTTRKLLELVNLHPTTNIVVGYKMNAQKFLAFLYTNSEKNRERNQGKNPIHHSFENNKILRNKFTQKKSYV